MWWWSVAGLARSTRTDRPHRVERNGGAADLEEDLVVLDLDAADLAGGERGGPVLRVLDRPADQVRPAGKLFELQHLVEVRVEGLDPLQGRELRQLGDEVGVLDGVQRVLVLQLGDEQLQELVLPQAR